MIFFLPAGLICILAPESNFLIPKMPLPVQNGATSGTKRCLCWLNEAWIFENAEKMKHLCRGTSMTRSLCGLPVIGLCASLGALTSWTSFKVVLGNFRMWKKFFFVYQSHKYWNLMDGEDFEIYFY